LATTLRLPPTCQVLCGLHDSNAALVAARAQVGAERFAVLSTGTWFVAMQSGGETAPALDPARDTLLNVDVEGRPVPSARVMGGRLYAQQLAGGASAEEADRAVAERAAELLDLVGAQGPVLVEGRFAGHPAFLRALAERRPEQPVLRAVDGCGVAFGAARLVWPALDPAESRSAFRPTPIASTGGRDKHVALSVTGSLDFFLRSSAVSLAGSGDANRAHQTPSDADAQEETTCG
jgi:hypothetical protein